MFYKAIVKGKRPLQAASHAITSTANSSSALFSRVFVKRTVRTLKQGALRRSLSTRSSIPPETTPPPLPSSHGVPLYRRIMLAWTKTPTKWYPLPLAVGAILLVVIQYRKKVARAENEVHVHVIGALPLRNMSRIWGYMNFTRTTSLDTALWLPALCIRFCCNLEEIDPDDLAQYASLGQFFYRKLKPWCQAIDNAILVSPADGTNLRVEQVKGITYSLDALLGPTSTVIESQTEEMSHVTDQEFANVNGIEYSLGQLLGASTPSTPGTVTPPIPRSQSASEAESSSVSKKFGEQIDASVEHPGSLQETIAHDASVAREMGLRPSMERRRSTSGTSVKKAMHFISLSSTSLRAIITGSTAPLLGSGERRHFVGELFSRLQNLFVLNERVALLGRWKFGFFGMIPVGATNVGSIKINFDTALRTNVRGRPPPPGTYNEAVYSAADGGFCLGSTIVLVFEAPKTKVKVGNRVGGVPNDSAAVRKVKID
ncbi:phosphatidylserine decarboxylase-domain-containing protein [Suillus subluteus]|nr:phosphatidylserine decarboxylase-domain-containing protein [Suillus subluteus]